MTSPNVIFEKFLLTIHPVREGDKNIACHLMDHSGEVPQRPKWRDNKQKDTAVRVYTVAQESVNLLVFQVPSFASESDLVQLLRPFGEIHCCRKVSDHYEHESFTDVYHVKHVELKSSRAMKKKCDEISLLGSHLHVQYAPELESLQETQQKFLQRGEDVRCLVEGYESQRARALLRPPQPAILGNDDSKFPPKPITVAPTVRELLPLLFACCWTHVFDKVSSNGDAEQQSLTERIRARLKRVGN